MLSLPKRQLDNFLGQDTGLDSVDAIIAALKKCQALQVWGGGGGWRAREGWRALKVRGSSATD